MTLFHLIARMPYDLRVILIFTGFALMVAAPTALITWAITRASVQKSAPMKVQKHREKRAAAEAALIARAKKDDTLIRFFSEAIAENEQVMRTAERTNRVLRMGSEIATDRLDIDSIIGPNNGPKEVL